MVCHSNTTHIHINLYTYNRSWIYKSKKRLCTDHCTATGVRAGGFTLVNKWAGGRTHELYFTKCTFMSLTSNLLHIQLYTMQSSRFSSITYTNRCFSNKTTKMNAFIYSTEYISGINVVGVSIPRKNVDNKDIFL